MLVNAIEGIRSFSIFFIIHFLSLLALHLYFLKSKEWRIPKRHEGVPELQEECGGVHGHHGGVQWPHSGDQEQQGRGVRRSPTAGLVRAGVRRRVLTSRYPWTQLLIQVLTSPQPWTQNLIQVLMSLFPSGNVFMRRLIYEFNISIDLC